MAIVYNTLFHDFGNGTCRDCGEVFKRSGYSHLRCDACAPNAKRASLHRAKRKYRERLSPRQFTHCSRCQTPFPGNVHKATKRCPSCTQIARNEMATARYASDPERHRAYGRNYAERHKERLAVNRKTPEQRARIAGWEKQRRQNDPAYRLHCNMSRVINLSLRGHKGGRKWETLVGYTLYQLMRHLERQFTRRMTWENMGREGWHIDHVIPRVLFDIRKAGDEEFLACWALANLRPLWHFENMSKSDKRLHLL